MAIGWVVWGLTAVAAVLAGSALWWATNPPRAIGWTPAVPWFERGIARLDRGLRRRWSPVTRQQAEILAIPPLRVLFFYLVAGLGGALLGYDFLHGILGAMIIGGLLAWKGPAFLIGRQFRARQVALARDFPPLVLMLRIYLDLGESLPQALRHTRPAISRVGQAELNRMLSAVQAGVRQSALKRWAQRTGLSTYKLLADTLAQGWDQGLTADALKPLDTLIESSREQGTRALTERLDGATTIVPMIAAFGVMAVLMYALLVGSGIG
jgi:Flp pilus assembly protein TadB